MKTLHLKLSSAHIRFSSNFPQLFDFVGMYFEKIQVSPAETIEPEISIMFDWCADSVGSHFQKFKGSGVFSQIGGSTLINSNEVVTIKKIERRWKVLLHLRLDGERIQFKVFFQRKGFKDYFRYGPFSKPKDDWYFSFIYHTIYYPLFWYLEQFKGRYPLHASALKVDGKGMVICGLEGIGKTSLNLMLLRGKNSQFLSDNIVFYDHKSIYPCYELIRLHQGEDKTMWDGKFVKINRSHVMKDFYAPLGQISEEGIKPDIVIFPEFSSRFKSVKLSVGQAVDRAILLSYIPDELNNYADYRHLYQLLRLESNPWIDQHKELTKSFSQAKCYSIGMVKDAGLKHNVEKLKDEINQIVNHG